MEANKDKAWQGNGCGAFFTFFILLFFFFLPRGAGPFAASVNLILFPSLRTLNLKDIQGVYSYTHSANFKSVSTPLKK